MSSWVNVDNVAALEFVNGQPEGEMRDSAAATYVFANGDGDVRQSLALAESISDESSRGRALGVTAIRWAQEDKDAAVEYVQNSASLSDEVKARIIERVSREGGGSGGFGGRGPGGGGGRGGR